VIQQTTSDDNQAGPVGTAILTIFIFCLLTGFQPTYGDHCVVYDSREQTIALLCGASDLFDISDQLGRTDILIADQKGTWTLNANLLIGNDATLNINSTYMSWLKINSTSNLNPFHINVLGTLNIDNLKISSWDYSTQNYAESDGSSPRPYISVLPGATGKIVFRNSEISFLGYNHPLRQGLSFYDGHIILENNTIHNLYYGIFYSTIDFVNKNNTLYNNVYDVNEPSIGTTMRTTRQGSADNVLPFVAIRYPISNSTIPSGEIKVQGNAFDEQSGIQKVEIFEHTFPFNGKYPFELATPLTKRNWSTWDYDFTITKPGLHRILAKVTDGVGNENWADTLFEVVAPITHTITEKNLDGNYYRPSLAVVEPTFTEGAYNVGGFYGFYPKYDKIEEGKHVKTDLDLLTSRIIRNNPETLLSLMTHLRHISDTNVPIISDEDLHEGYIFTKNGSNVYDVLFILHGEYATKESYSNLRQFVNNGGTVVFVDGNVLYAEVAYKSDMHTVTLMRGHGWKFNGSSAESGFFAEKNVRERWASENTDWIGSNFLWSNIAEQIKFANDPFNYTHFEENYVTNPRAHILYDYGAIIPPEVLRANKLSKTPHIASYSLQHGHGKVLMIGLYGQHLLKNPTFLQFFDNIVLPQAIGQTILADNNMTIYSYMSSGKISKLEIKENRHLVVSLERAKNSVDKLYITIPKEMISLNDTRDHKRISVLIDGKEILEDLFVGANEVGMMIPLSPGTGRVEIQP
jgi:hypothetical protein